MTSEQIANAALERQHQENEARSASDEQILEWVNEASRLIELAYIALPDAGTSTDAALSAIATLSIVRSDLMLDGVEA